MTDASTSVDRQSDDHKQETETKETKEKLITTWEAFQAWYMVDHPTSDMSLKSAADLKTCVAWHPYQRHYSEFQEALGECKLPVEAEEIKESDLARLLAFKRTLPAREVGTQLATIDLRSLEAFIAWRDVLLATGLQLELRITLPVIEEHIERLNGVYGDGWKIVWIKSREAWDKARFPPQLRVYKGVEAHEGKEAVDDSLNLSGPIDFQRPHPDARPEATLVYPGMGRGLLIPAGGTCRIGRPTDDALYALMLYFLGKPAHVLGTQVKLVRQIGVELPRD